MVLALVNTLAINAAENVFSRWHIDDDIKIDFTKNGSKLLIRISNQGNNARVISSLVFDPDTIISNYMVVRFVDFDTPRKQRDEFRLASDGVVGANSEMFPVTSKYIEPGNEITTEIDLVSSLKQVKNEKLHKYLAMNGTHAQLSFTIQLRSIGIKSNSSLKYVFPEMIIRNNSGELSLELPVMEIDTGK